MQIKKPMNTLLYVSPTQKQAWVYQWMSDRSTTLHLIYGKSKTLIHTHSHKYTHKGILVLGWMRLSCLTENTSYCLFMISHQVKGDSACMCAAVAFVCVFTLMRLSWLSKDRNKASKSKRHGLLHRRVQMATLWGELKCVRDRASDERQHYFREGEREKQRHWREDMTSCSKKLFTQHKATSVSGTSPNRQQQIETNWSRNDFDTYIKVFTKIKCNGNEGFF